MRSVSPSKVLKTGLMVGLGYLTSTAAVASTPTPECISAAKERNHHRARCEKLKKGCADGERTACRERLSECGIVAKAEFTDKVMKACGNPDFGPMPSAQTEEPEPANEQPGPTAREDTPAPEPSRPVRLPRAGIHVYGRPKCSMILSVLDELRKVGLPYTFHHYGREPGSKELVKRHRSFLHGKYLPLLVVDGRPVHFDFGNVPAACGQP